MSPTKANPREDQTATNKHPSSAKGPKHVVMVIADSLRYDSVWDDNDAMLPKLQQRATTYHQAYSAGCWTLPSHGSIFTGLLPHEHGATTRSRGLRKDVQTLAEFMKDHGYETRQLTANTVTTHIFGLDRGFDRVEKVWDVFETGNVPLTSLLVLLGKRRIRNKLLNGDFIEGKMTEDIKAGQTWVRSFGANQFERAEALLKEADERNRKLFLFINLMETHFPYHISGNFKTLSNNPIDQYRELKSLYHLVNQTWLIKDKQYFQPDVISRIRRRQKQAWKRIAPRIDDFSDYMASEHPESLYIFASDHGENFGDEGWMYHFSNVTEAGNRVPVFLSGMNIPENKMLARPVSIRSLNPFIKNSVTGGPTLDHFHANGDSVPILESFWYNRNGQTLPKYKRDQFGFILDNCRYVKKNGEWEAFELGEEDSAQVKPVPCDSNPIHDLAMPSKQREALEEDFARFTRFSKSLS